MAEPATRDDGPRPPRGSTFTAQDWRILARFWHPVAVAAEVSDQPAAVRLLDEALVVYRAAGRILVARDLCVHRGTPLSLGWVEGEEIICRYHGFRYGPDGRCRLIPAQPADPIAPRLRIAVYPVVERFGLVWTCLDPAAGEAPPENPLWDDPSFQRIVCPPIDIAGSAGRQTEGFIDVAHFAWVHHETFADRANQEVPRYKVERTANGFTADYVSTVANFPKGLGLQAPPGFMWRRFFEVAVPFAARLTITFPEGGLLCIMNCASPVSARQTRLFVPILRNFGKDGPLEEVYAFNRRIFEEDRAIVEAQRPEDLPLDLSAEVHIAADRSSVAYRQALAALGLGEAYTR